jgi:curved DNA-binding protein CbpA
MFYHPDKGGDGEKFKRLTQAYELVMKNRGAN